MKKKIICIGIISMFLLTSFASISIVKADFVDQECASGDTSMITDNFYRPLAQSFTTSVMALTGFEVKLKRSGDTTGSVRIGIKESLDEDFLEGTVKAISVSSISSNYAWFKCTFDEPLSPIILGSEAFIALQLVEIPPDDITIHWSGDDSNPYGGGCAYKKPGADEEWKSQNNFDFNFRTYGFNEIFFGVTNNGGTIVLDGVEYEAGGPIEHHSGTYTLSANIKPNHEFGSWLALPPNFIKFDDPDSDTTHVTITGHGTIVLCCKNQPPNKPETPNGPSTAHHKQTELYSTSATDINGDKLKYGWDWDGDDIVDEWDNNNENYYSSGETVTTSHSWDTPGTYIVKVKAKDDDWVNNGESEWSDPFIVTVLNTAPNTPWRPDGPTQGCTGVEYEYKIKSSDPNQDQVKYGWDWDGDDIVDEWTRLYLHMPNVYRTITHTFSTAGTYNIQVKAEDEYGDQSSFSPALTIVITTDTNNPPTAVIDSIRPNPANQGQTVAFTGHGTDPDSGDTITGYNWRSTIGGQLSTATSFSSSTLSVGTHTIYFKVQDNNGAWSTEVSQTLTINPTSNNPPNKPSTPIGKTNGKAETSYPYSTSTTDPDGNKVKYGWDKNGDGTADIWDDNGGSYYSSGTAISTSLSWSSKGTYTLKVIAEDEHGAQSPWSDPLSVSMPRSRAINTPFFNFLQNHPILFQLFQRFLKL